MSLISEALASLPEKSNGGLSKCRFAELFEKFPEDKDDVIAAVTSPRFSNAALAKTLTSAAGFNIGESTVRNHRRGMCKFCSEKGIRY